MMSESYAKEDTIEALQAELKTSQAFGHFQTIALDKERVENAKLHKAITRFKNAWDDNDSDDTTWETEVNDSRSALWEQAKEPLPTEPKTNDCDWRTIAE